MLQSCRHVPGNIRHWYPSVANAFRPDRWFKWQVPVKDLPGQCVVAAIYVHDSSKTWQRMGKAHNSA